MKALRLRAPRIPYCMRKWGARFWLYRVHVRTWRRPPYLIFTAPLGFRDRIAIPSHRGSTRGVVARHGTGTPSGAGSLTAYYLFPDSLRHDSAVLAVFCFVVLAAEGHWRTAFLSVLILIWLAPMAIFVLARKQVLGKTRAKTPRYLAHWLSAVPAFDLTKFAPIGGWPSRLWRRSRRLVCYSFHCLPQLSLSKPQQVYWRFSASPQQSFLRAALRERFFSPSNNYHVRNLVYFIVQYCNNIWISFGGLCALQYSRGISGRALVVLAIGWFLYCQFFFWKRIDDFFRYTVWSVYDERNFRIGLTERRDLSGTLFDETLNEFYRKAALLGICLSAFLAYLAMLKITK